MLNSESDIPSMQHSGADRQKDVEEEYYDNVPRGNMATEPAGSVTAAPAESLATRQKNGLQRQEESEDSEPQIVPCKGSLLKRQDAGTAPATPPVLTRQDADSQASTPPIVNQEHQPQYPMTDIKGMSRSLSDPDKESRI